MGRRGESTPSSREFDALFDSNYRHVLAYALRRSRREADAEEVVAETFVVAWRRLEDAPPMALPWLYGIARRLLANQRRGAERRSRLHLRLWSQRRGGTRELRMEGGPATEALARLPEDDQELLRLVAWEGLDHAAIAQVLSISANAVAIRLHRARAKFSQQLAAISSNPKDSTAIRTPAHVTGRTAGRDRQEDA